MTDSDRLKKLVLLAAVPVASFAIYISWLIVPQIVRIVVVDVSETVATR